MTAWLLFPPAWPVLAGVATFRAVRKVASWPKKGIIWWYNSKYWPTTYVGKAFAFSIAGFILAPGTIPWMFYQGAKAAGFEKEMEALLSWLVWLGTTSWDMIVWSYKVAEKVVHLATMMM